MTISFVFRSKGSRNSPRPRDAGDDLGRHVVGRARQAVELVLAVGAVDAREAKVDDLDLALGVGLNQNILWFQITMNQV